VDRQTAHMYTHAEHSTVVSCRHAEYLAETDSDDTLPYCIAAGNVGLAVWHLTSRGHLSDAVLVAAAADEGSVPLYDRSSQRRLRKLHKEDRDEQNERFMSFESCLFSCSICQIVP